jgi:hypothetical protein
MNFGDLPPFLTYAPIPFYPAVPCKWSTDGLRYPELLIKPGKCYMYCRSSLIILNHTIDLKGTVSRDFLLQFFFMNHLPPSP